VEREIGEGGANPNEGAIKNMNDSNVVRDIRHDEMLNAGIME
jgi:hypothetical protein